MSMREWKVKAAIAIGLTIVFVGINSAINTFFPAYSFNPLRTLLQRDLPIDSFEEEEPSPDELEKTQKSEASVLTTVPAPLWGTQVQQDPNASRAYLGNSFLRIGEEIQDGIVIEAIQRDKVIVRNSAKTDQLALIPLTPLENIPIATEEKVFREEARFFLVERKYIEAALADLAHFLRDADTKIWIDGEGKPIGYRLNYVRQGGVYDRLGFTADDLLLEINGHALTSNQAPLRFYQQLRYSSFVQVTAQRSGQKKQISYLIRN